MERWDIFSLAALGENTAAGSCKPGDRLGGRYTLERMLGHGASGQVWQAVQEPLGRTVAIKVLKSDAKGRAAVRFLQEARIAGQLQSRYVVRLFDFGTAEQGQLYMVMEHLHGETLGARLARQPDLTVKELLRYMGQALLGIAEVHAAGIVHRDLKPDNIFLENDGTEIFSKILDFGVSRVEDTGPLGGDLSKLTGTGMTVGTPLFMAPEQARGLRDQIDGRTDIYALGVILYKALTGKPPFADANVVELLMAVVAATSAPAAIDERPEVPSELSVLIQKAMAPRRGDRFASAEQMRLALANVEPLIGRDMLCRWSGRGVASNNRSLPTELAPLVSPTDADATVPQSLLSLSRLLPPVGTLPVWLPWAIAGFATMVAAVAVGVLLAR